MEEEEADVLGIRSDDKKLYPQLLDYRDGHCVRVNPASEGREGARSLPSRILVSRDLEVLVQALVGAAELHQDSLLGPNYNEVFEAGGSADVLGHESVVNQHQGFLKKR